MKTILKKIETRLFISHLNNAVRLRTLVGFVHFLNSIYSLSIHRQLNANNKTRLNGIDVWKDANCSPFFAPKHKNRRVRFFLHIFCKYLSICNANVLCYRYICIMLFVADWLCACPPGDAITTAIGPS